MDKTASGGWERRNIPVLQELNSGRGTNVTNDSSLVAGARLMGRKHVIRGIVRKRASNNTTYQSAEESTRNGAMEEEVYIYSTEYKY